MAALVGVGIVTTLLVREPPGAASSDTAEREARVIAWLERKAHWPESLRSVGEWFIGAVICPLVDSSAVMCRARGVMLVFAGVYRLTESRSAR